jgi:hypothetical protein
MTRGDRTAVLIAAAFTLLQLTVAAYLLYPCWLRGACQ